MRRTRQAFTLIEVIACVLILAMALTAACGLIMYGLQLVRAAHGRTVGLATAMTVIADPSPLQTDPSLTPNGATTSGYLNGLWVVRTESDATPLDGAVGKLIAVTVKVDVYETGGGACFVSTCRRLIRNKP